MHFGRETGHMSSRSDRREGVFIFIKTMVRVIEIRSWTDDGLGKNQAGGIKLIHPGWSFLLGLVGSTRCINGKGLAVIGKMYF